MNPYTDLKTALYARGAKIWISQGGADSSHQSSSWRPQHIDCKPAWHFRNSGNHTLL